jgi:hypothetical protein
MRKEASPPSLENFWRKLFPDQIPEHLPIAGTLPNNELELEGFKMVAVNTWKTSLALSPRRDSIFAISIVWTKPQIPPASCMMRCLKTLP